MNRYSFLQNTYFLPFFFVLISAISLSGCKKGEAGELGPKGVQGAQGAKGMQGPRGLSGELPIKSGFISGTITGALSDNTPVSESFKNELTYKSNPSTFSLRDDRYYFTINRFDTLVNQYIYMQFNVATDFSSPNFSFGVFWMDKKLDNGQIIHIDAFQSRSATTSRAEPLSNLAYDVKSGLLTCNFNWVVDNAQITNPGSYYSETSSLKTFTIKGSFSIPFKQNVYRIAVSGQ